LNDDGYYLFAKRLETTVVAIAELPEMPETLWLRLLSKRDTQQRAIAQLLELPFRDAYREHSSVPITRLLCIVR
jgi:hypothetical protein